MSVFWTVISAISTASGNFKTRCPECSAKMQREEKHDQAYTKTKHSRQGLQSAARTGMYQHTGRTVQIVPVFDVCVECGYAVRRKNLKLG